MLHLVSDLDLEMEMGTISGMAIPLDLAIPVPASEKR